MKKIEILIDADGNVTVEAHGYVGGECEEATRLLEWSLGKRTARKAKPERHQQGARQEAKAR